MRIRCEIIEVVTKGNALMVRYQGKQPGMPDWQETLTGRVDVPCNPKTERAYHVGRTFHMELKPE